MSKLIERMRRRTARELRWRVRSRAKLRPSVDVGVADLPELVASHRVTSPDRLRMLELVTADLGRRLGGSGARVEIDDASEPEWSARAIDAWHSTGLDVNVRVGQRSLAA